MKHRIRPLLSGLFANEGFRGPVLTLLSGSSAVLALAFLAQPVLSRLYEEGEFAVMGYFVSVVATIVSFSSLRYEDALMLPKKDRDAGVVVWLALCVLGCTAAVVAGLSIWREQIAAFAGIPSVAPFLLLVAPTLLAMRLTKVAELWLMRNRKFRLVTAAQVANTSTMVVTRIGADTPPLTAGAEGLVGGFVAGHVVSSLVIGLSVARRYGKLILGCFDIRALLRAAVRYRRFPLFSTPSSFFSTLTARLPVFLIPLFFDEIVLGLFIMALNVLVIPLGHLGSAVARVFFVHAAKARLENRLAGVSEMVHGRLVMLALVPVAAVMLVGPDLFHFVFSEKWREAGSYARFIAPWLFFQAIASPLTRIFDVTERQRVDFLTTLGMFVAMLAALVFGGRTGSMTTMLLWFGAVGALARVFQICVLLSLARVPLRRALRPYLRYGAMGLPGIALILASLAAQSPAVTSIATALALATYAAIVVWKDEMRLTVP